MRGGAADAKVGDKSGYGEQYALEMRLPLVRLVEAVVAVAVLKHWRWLVTPMCLH
ncbi:MAG: hypothetical protein CM1200mP40_33180 [Gammaproteobacteria bacterium]|nr:MAG: hypothetical protein CM1200mP40_33180 [Gammaproteobacteria bacterium]